MQTTVEFFRLFTRIYRITMPPKTTDAQLKRKPEFLLLDTVVIAGYLAKEYLLLKEYDRRLQAGDSPNDNNAEMSLVSNLVHTCVPCRGKEALMLRNMYCSGRTRT